MKKKIFIALLILTILIFCGVVYLNNVILPTKVKSLIIAGLQEITHKKVSLESVRINIFKGLVLRNLNIYDGENTVASLKEGSCTFLILPFFKQKLIIPALKLESPRIFLERRKDNTLNVLDLFGQNNGQSKEKKMDIIITRIQVSGGVINFQDDTLPGPFTKTLKDIDLNLWLSLPDRLRFNLKSKIPGKQPVNINAAGDFKIAARQLNARASIKDLSPGEFAGYYQNLGINIAEGFIDIQIDLRLKENNIYAALTAPIRGLNISRDKVSVRLNSEVKADLRYGLKDNKWEFAGRAGISGSEISGLDFAQDIKDISGEISFDNKGAYSDKLYAKCWGTPIEAGIKLADFNNPELNIAITSDLELVFARGILKDKFNFALPGDIRGKGRLSLSIHALIPAEVFEVSGYLDIKEAELKLEKVNSPVENINGRLAFSPGQLKWDDFNFKYRGEAYKTSGSLSNFQSPSVQLSLASKDLTAESYFEINNRLIKLSKLKGRYLNSEFLLAGDMDTSGPPALKLDLAGELNLDLRDLNAALKKFKKQLDEMKPGGAAHARFHINGDINDFKSCALESEISGDSISLYGLAGRGLVMNCNQAGGIINIPLIHLSLYDGTVDAAGSMNLNSGNLPYWLSADIKGVKIEKLKTDTAFKKEDISGVVQAQFKISGFSGDLSRLTGAGKISITEGRLWQLNLFKGLGSLLFAKDFANIVFSEGNCGFIIQDKYISTDSLSLKSNIANLSGPIRIGFDTSIDASLNVEVLSEMVPLTGTFKDVTTAIIGQSGVFGVMKISGTLKEPKYKFKPAVVGIIKSIKDTLLGN